MQRYPVLLLWYLISFRHGIGSHSFVCSSAAGASSLSAEVKLTKSGMPSHSERFAVSIPVVIHLSLRRYRVSVVMGLVVAEVSRPTGCWYIVPVRYGIWSQILGVSRLKVVG